MIGLEGILEVMARQLGQGLNFDQIRTQFELYTHQHG